MSFPRHESVMSLAAATLRACFAPSFCVAVLSLGSSARGQSQIVECAGCHAAEAAQFAESVHHRAVRCQDCHGGENAYELSDEQLRRYTVAPAPDGGGTAARPEGRGSSTASAVGPEGRGSSEPPAARFDHGGRFRGKPERTAVPETCGNCHADVARMNPYGLKTDQLAGYRVSGHGKRLANFGDTRVAVCTDCHGIHDVLRSDHPHSRTHFLKIPDTCGRCHADPRLMAEYNIPATIVEQYRNSIHGRNLLERQDPGSPHCATCHGNHAAAPPGYLEVGHVCGKCHQQIEEYFIASVHGRIPVMARCIGCHARGGQRWNHQIEKASLPLDELTKLYAALPGAAGGDDPALRSLFSDALHTKSEGAIRLNEVCSHCHGQVRQDPHAGFFERSDREADELGRKLTQALEDAQFNYARTAARVERLSRGVLWVRDESLRAEDAKTETMALAAAVHTLDLKDIEERAKKVADICAEVHTQLDAKEAGLTRRKVILLAAWLFVAGFVVLMYCKYLELKRQYVSTSSRLPATASGATAAPCAAPLTRRKWLDGVLSAMGAVTVLGILWPAVAYVLPARRRGGGVERVSAGKSDGWAVGEARKVSVSGKPAIVLRQEQGFRAYSAVCTHLGCIVHWDQGSKSFLCPCHAAVFDAEGKVVSGPPPLPLPVYGVKVAQGEVFVSPDGA